MANQKQRPIRTQILGAVSSDILAAKAELRERMLAEVVGGTARALVARQRKQYTSSLSVNIVGFGVGEKITDRMMTGEMCIKVFVAKKFPKSRIAKADLVPESINDIQTDVEAVGYPKAFMLGNRERHRPAVGGVSIGLTIDAVGYQYAGTLGLIVRERNDATKLYALSNNHVLADENRVAIGAKIVQPGTLDGGKASDRIGELAQFVPLKFNNRRNYVDAAIASFSGVQVDNSILGLGVLRGASRPAINMLVRKAGRTTGLTEGVVRAVNSDIFDIGYDQGMVRVDDCMVIRSLGSNKSFSRAGDSGSAIVNSQGKVVGLLFAGSDVATFATPINRVLRHFKVQIAK